jgi:hypothetical protein
MQHRRSSKLLATSVASLVILAACGSDAKTTTTGAPTTTTGGTTAVTTAPTTGATTGVTTGGSAVSLKGICPDNVGIQTDWMPEAEHGFLYQMVGKGYTIDKSKAVVTGPLIDGNGNDTGVTISVHSGGAAQHFDPVTKILYDNPDSLLLGYVYTDEAIQFSGSDTPTVAIESGFEKNPQMIMWDPNTYPDVKGIADLGKANVKVRYFGGAAYMDFLTGTGVLSKSEVDGSYTGDPSLFIADNGKSAQQGFGSAEPYQYETGLVDTNGKPLWGKKVSYQYINDIGWKNYAESISTRPENITKYADCFKKLVPIIQQASVNYVNSPAAANAVILAATDAFGKDFGWTYDQGAADYGVKTIKADGLVANGTDGVMGSFDDARVADLITKAVPVYTAQGATPKAGLKPSDIVTNQFLDTSIHL